MSSEAIVRFRCVSDGKRLRVRVITPGYNPEANCQFPRAIRTEGKEYEAPVTALSFSEQRGKFFYRVMAKMVREVMAAGPATIYESSECVICMDSSPAIVYAPCGHFCACAACDSEMAKKPGRLCPMCRSPIHTSVTRDQLQL